MSKTKLPMCPGCGMFCDTATDHICPGRDVLHYSATRKAREADALQTQVGGDHYKSMPIQPIEFISKNGLDFLQGNVIKYITRHKSKNGRQDVEKALHYCQLILELQYGEGE